MSLTSLIPAGGEFCVLRADVVDKLLTCADGDGALLYLYLIRKGSALFEERTALHDLHFTRDRYERAVHTLTKLQLVSSASQPMPQSANTSVRAPRYTASEMRVRREGDHRFASVCQTAEIVLGRTLTESQLRTLMTAYDHLGLPADVLIDLLHYLHRTKGIVSRRDIEEQTHLWADMGIFSAEAAAEFLSKREAEKPLLDAMLRALDMAGRDPAPNEYRFLREFIAWGFDADAVALAKDRMYERLGSFSWKYLKGILHQWHEKGLHTVSEITAVEPATRTQTPTQASNAAPQPPQNGGLSDWEKEWLDEFSALSRREDDRKNGI